MSDWIGTGRFCSFKRKENFSNQDKHSQTLVTTLVLDGNLFRTLETGCIHNIKVNIFPPHLLIRIIIINILLIARYFPQPWISLSLSSRSSSASWLIQYSRHYRQHFTRQAADLQNGDQSTFWTTATFLIIHFYFLFQWKFHFSGFH